MWNSSAKRQQFFKQTKWLSIRKFCIIFLILHWVFFCLFIRLFVWHDETMFFPPSFVTAEVAVMSCPLPSSLVSVTAWADELGSCSAQIWISKAGLGYTCYLVHGFLYVEPIHWKKIKLQSSMDMMNPTGGCIFSVLVQGWHRRVLILAEVSECCHKREK